jgi:hypothetical protein
MRQNVVFQAIFTTRARKLCAEKTFSAQIAQPAAALTLDSSARLIKMAA